jgi:hypothetical protein
MPSDESHHNPEASGRSAQDMRASSPERRLLPLSADEVIRFLPLMAANDFLDDEVA